MQAISRTLLFEDLRKEFPVIKGLVLPKDFSGECFVNLRSWKGRTVTCQSIVRILPANFDGQKGRPHRIYVECPHKGCNEFVSAGRLHLHYKTHLEEK